jgi:hypothetical protein
MKNLFLAVALVAASSLPAFAAEKVTVTETVKLDAPVAKVWALLGHFSDMSWHPAVKSTEASNGDNKGSQRRLDLGGPILWESLSSSSDASHSYSYRILDNGSNQKVLPVSGYSSSIKVKAAGAGSEVIWSSTFSPATGSTADASKKAVAGVYRGGLDALAKELAPH